MRRVSLRKDSQLKKLEQRPPILVKLKFSESTESKLSGLPNFHKIWAFHKSKTEVKI